MARDSFRFFVGADGDRLRSYDDDCSRCRKLEHALGRMEDDLVSERDNAARLRLEVDRIKGDLEQAKRDHARAVAEWEVIQASRVVASAILPPPIEKPEAVETPTPGTRYDLLEVD